MQWLKHKKVVLSCQYYKVNFTKGIQKQDRPAGHQAVFNGQMGHKLNVGNNVNWKSITLFFNYLCK